MEEKLNKVLFFILEESILKFYFFFKCVVRAPRLQPMPKSGPATRACKKKIIDLFKKYCQGGG